MERDGKAGGGRVAAAHFGCCVLLLCGCGQVRFSYLTGRKVDIGPGGCGKAAHSPRTEKNGDFFGQIFWLRFFYTKPERLGFDHTHLVLIFFLQMLAHLEYLHK